MQIGKGNNDICFLFTLSLNIYTESLHKQRQQRKCYMHKYTPEYLPERTTSQSELRRCNVASPSCHLTIEIFILNGDFNNENIIGMNWLPKHHKCLVFLSLTSVAWSEVDPSSNVAVTANISTSEPILRSANTREQPRCK